VSFLGFVERIVIRVSTVFLMSIEEDVSAERTKNRGDAAGVVA